MSVFLIECNVRKNAYSYFLPLPPSGIKAFDMHRRYLYIVGEKTAAAHLPLNNPCCKNPPILASSEKTFDVRTAQYSFDIHMAAQHQIWPLGATSLAGRLLAGISNWKRFLEEWSKSLELTCVSSHPCLSADFWLTSASAATSSAFPGWRLAGFWLNRVASSSTHMHTRRQKHR